MMITNDILHNVAIRFYLELPPEFGSKELAFVFKKIELKVLKNVMEFVLENLQVHLAWGCYIHE